LILEDVNSLSDKLNEWILKSDMGCKAFWCGMDIDLSGLDFWRWISFSGFNNP